MAYAAVVSLKQTIKCLLNSSDSRILLPNSELESINEDLCSLQSILETIIYVQNSKRADALEGQIKDLAHELEDLIESHTSYRFLSESESSRDESLTLTSAFFQELLKVKQELRSFTKTLKTEEGYKTEDQQPSVSFAADAVSSRIDSRGKNKMVGLDDELKQLKVWLLQDSKKLDVVSIFGMAGIGKTTLVKEVYYDELVSCTFRHRFFVTIGPHQLKEFLLLVVNHMGIAIDDIHKKTDKEIGFDLYQFLVGRRYLIVLDDIWNTRVWNELKHFFPDDQKSGSRIILTTRQQGVAHLASTNKNFLQVPFLDDHRSWTLLHQMVFTPEESCPSRLEEIGRTIAKKCEGLPLAVVSVAKLLCEEEKTVENWSRIAENEISRTISVDYYTITEALSSSYKQLPPHLKACFLYMGVFPQNYEIPTSKLLKLWVAEGFFEPQRSKTLEEMARECLDDLVSRSLVLVRERSSRGRTKTCRIHFLIRDLCVAEAKKENFFQIVKDHVDISEEGPKSQRRLCIHNNVVLALKDVHSMMQSISAARSLLCVGPQHQHLLQVYLSFTFLRVLDALTIRFHKFPKQVLKLVQLKYLAMTYDGELPASISGLWNLEVLIVHRHQSIKSSDSPVYLPIEIWKLHGLRHLECMGFDLPDPSTATRGINDDGSDDSLILEKLLTLSGVSAHSYNQGVFARMPNLCKLRILIESTHDAVKTFSFSGDCTDICLKLESLKCIVMNRGLASRVASLIRAFPKNKITFPIYLRKITLSRCGFCWEDITSIGRLPNLEVLKLRCYAFRGPEWETHEEEFLQLKFLLLEDLDIEHWAANYEHFPLLEHLTIRHCYKLVGLPDDIIEIPALKMIEVDDCSPSAMNSARKAEVDQEESGNNYPQFRIHSSWEDGKNLTE